MKKFLVFAIVGAMMLSGSTIGALAESERNNYTDADSDGVCDNYGSYSNFVDANNDGVCDNNTDCENQPHDGTGRQNGKDNLNLSQGGNYTDENGDGVCDNKTDYQNRPQNGTGVKKDTKTAEENNFREIRCAVNRK